MNTRQTAYAAIVAIAGAAVFYVSFQTAARLAVAGGFPLVVRLMVTALIFALLRSFPGKRGARRVSLTHALVFAASLIFDASLAIVAYEASTLLTFARDEKTGKPRSVLNGSLRALVFGDAVMILSTALGALLYRAPADAPLLFRWPASLWHTGRFALAMGGIAWTLLFLMEVLGDRKAVRSALRGLLLRLPCVPLCVAFSCLLALIQQIRGGDGLTMLCVVTLLAARYAFVRYRGSRAQYDQIIQTLSEAIEAKDPYSQGHSARVERCALMVGRAMRLSGKRLKNLRLAARLHDIGKVGIDDIMLRKDTSLDEREWEDMRKHPSIGHRIIAQIELSKAVDDAILHHHECYDGSGYPQGLKMSELPIEDSILATAAAFVAMTSDRPYRAGMGAQQALDVLRAEAGKQFHPQVVRAFEKCAKDLLTA
jgi:hypothetical protein